MFAKHGGRSRSVLVLEIDKCLKNSLCNHSAGTAFVVELELCIIQWETSIYPENIGYYNIH